MPSTINCRISDSALLKLTQLKLALRKEATKLKLEKDINQPDAVEWAIRSLDLVACVAAFRSDRERGKV